jgi:5'-methylthioadenosine phosphorylase
MRVSSAEIGIIGGTGVYDQDILEDVEEVTVHTPYGQTSSLIAIGSYQGRTIAFIPRHGKHHQLPPHNIPFRANIWALKQLGVTRIISPSAVGSLREDYRPSEFVIIDQFIDRTKNRGDTFYEGGQVCHISTADPFCPELREIFSTTSKILQLPFHDHGTYVCIQGPRFSTKAESQLFRSWGADIIGMTLFPEVTLAREAEICFTTIAMITDYDVWANKPVSTDEVIHTMASNVENIQKLIMETIPKIPPHRTCSCGQALQGALI